MNTEILDAALGYAARGWPVFPCQPTKKPYTSHGYKDATVNTDQIRKWWGYWKSAAIGLDCGSARLLVIDLDTKNGVDAYGNWFALGIDATYALTSRTPSGGSHLIFTVPEGETLGSTVGKLAAGIDTRSEGGYVILPPSRILTGEYKALGNWDRSPMEAPRKLIELLTGREKPANAPRTITHPGSREAGEFWLAYYIAKAQPGCRNDMGFRLALQLRDEGFSFNQALDYLSDYAKRVPDPSSYHTSEALAAVRSAFQGHRREPARSINGR